MHIFRRLGKSPRSRFEDYCTKLTFCKRFAKERIWLPNIDEEDIMRKIVLFCFVIGLATLAQAQPTAGLKGLWEFNDSGDLTKATVGNDLVLTGNSGPGSHTAIGGISGGDGAVAIDVGSYYECYHGIPANGGSSGWVNEFTLLFDVQYPEESAGEWRAFYNSNWANTNDAEYFIHPSDESWGVGDLGYTDNSTVGEFYSSPSTWYRVVLTVNLETDTSLAFHDLYINGQLTGKHYTDSLGLDGRFSLYPSTHEHPIVALCGDNDGEDALMYYSNIAIWDRPLTGQEIASLGEPGDPIPEPVTIVLMGLGSLVVVRRRRR